MSKIHINTSLKALFIIGIILTFSTTFAQTQVVSETQKFDQLLSEKRKAATSLNTNERWRIQIFSGENETSKKALSEFRKNHKNLEATIVFQTPNYKVWVGNFRTRIEAERILKEIKDKYPNAFLIKPKK